MPTELEFVQLLKRNESETLDFKETLYDFDKPNVRNRFIKDVICMANTPRTGAAHIVFGVRWTPERKCELLGLDLQIEDILLIQKLGTDRVSRVPKIWYEQVAYKGKEFGVLGIPVDKSGPFLPTKTFGNDLVENQLYIRRGSMNVSANADDLKIVMEWFAKSGAQQGPAIECDTWSRFLEAVQKFEPQRRYLLLCDSIDVSDGIDLSGIGLAPWSAVIDFDPDSEDSGLLGTLRATIETRRNLQLVVKGERPSINPHSGTVWFFARGLTGRELTLSTGPHRDWIRHYGIELDDQLRAIAASLGPSPVSVVLLWNSSCLQKHLVSVLDVINKFFSDSVTVLFVGQDSDVLGSIPSDYGTDVFEFNHRTFAAGLKDFFRMESSDESERCAVPC